MSEILYNLLVVDDDERIRNLLSQYLIKEGFIVSTANGADVARKKIQLVKFDLIILDIMMPGDDGLTLTQEIRNNSDIPIILLTAKSGTDSKIEGLEIGYILLFEIFKASDAIRLRNGKLPCTVSFLS